MLLSLFWLIDTVYDTVVVRMNFVRDRGMPHLLEVGTHFVLFGVQMLLIMYVWRHVRASRRLEEEIRQLNAALERRAADLAAKNRELEAFSYSLSHDLNTPLTKVSVAVQTLQDSYGERLDDTGRFFVRSIVEGSERMEQLIDAMLVLSRVARRELRRDEVDLSALAAEVASELRQAEPQRQVEPVIASGLSATGDPALLRVALHNLFANAWKYTRRAPEPRVEFGALVNDGTTTYFVRDNGAGFDMKDLGRLFKPFQRLHDQEEFPGTGIGLATVQRIIERHGGTITAHSMPDHGATFTFTLR
ncbi:sensor histidine kinase [Geobacter pickeringii]|uniref:sensor histidine kinase n=1 Tax=Geobacter pickeringii TaxID=345632 RepID=UPI000691C83A|nr:ATP-binding protein [Geobacter pickeringii]